MVGRNASGALGRRGEPLALGSGTFRSPRGLAGALALGVLCAAVLPGASLACDLTLADVLAGKEKTPFDERVLRVSRLLEAAVPALVGQRQQGAAQQVGAAADRWTELYIELYLVPPPQAGDQEEWRALMDSVSGSMRRVRALVDRGALDQAHALLPMLQAQLGELYGAYPNKVADLGPVVQTVETLALLPPAGDGTLQEVRARTVLLRRRFEAWKSGAKPALRAIPAVADFEQGLARAEAALEAADYPRLDRALAGFETTPLLAQASRALWGLPPVAPQKTSETPTSSRTTGSAP